MSAMFIGPNEKRDTGVLQGALRKGESYGVAALKNRHQLQGWVAWRRGALTQAHPALRTLGGSFSILNSASRAVHDASNCAEPAPLIHDNTRAGGVYV